MGVVICIRGGGQAGQAAAASAPSDGTNPISGPEVCQRLVEQNEAERSKDAFHEGAANIVKRIEALVPLAIKLHKPRLFPPDTKPRFQPPAIKLTPHMVAQQKKSDGASQKQRGPPKVRFRSESRERFTFERDGASTGRHRPMFPLSEVVVLHKDDDPWEHLPRNRAYKCEMDRRAQRDALIKRKLMRGYAIVFRSTGKSLSPFVESGDACMFHPVLDAYNCIKVNDVVYCNVTSLDGNRESFMAHMVLAFSDEWWTDTETGKQHWKRRFIIGNIKRRVNGTAWDHDVYGRLVEVIE